MALVEFVFSDGSGRKLRPAVVVSSNEYHSGSQEVIIAAITSNVARRLFGEHVIREWREAGLLYPSTVTGLIRTVRRSMIQRKLGSLAQPDLDAVGRALRRCLDL